MSIKLNIHSALRHLVDNKSVIEVNGTTVGECLKDMIRQYPAVERSLFNQKGKLLNYVDIYVNLQSAFPEELAKPVKDGDEMQIVLMIAGG
jgi:molybdopterin converting factor small subunit